MSKLVLNSSELFLQISWQRSFTFNWQILCNNIRQTVSDSLIENISKALLSSTHRIQTIPLMSLVQCEGRQNFSILGRLPECFAKSNLTFESFPLFRSIFTNSMRWKKKKITRNVINLAGLARASWGINFTVQVKLPAWDRAGRAPRTISENLQHNFGQRINNA